MVVFTCNACNESLKKNQVEKHCQQKCRHCQYLSCVDCGKDFWGDTYQSHIKCISEEEKYSGKNYVPKVNKGEAKQDQWIQKVHAAIQKAPSNPQLRNLLQKLEEFSNVPRKKAKFVNFVKCSLRVTNPTILDQVWDLLMAEKEQKAEDVSQPSDKTDAALTENGNSDSTPSQDKPSESEETEKKLSKRERKEERQKKAHKSEKKDKKIEENGTAEEDTENVKKKKKRKKDDEDEEMVEESQPKKRKKKGNEEEETGPPAEMPPKKKKKGENGVAEETKEDENCNGVDSTEKKGKFNWGRTITCVLQSKGELSVKRLQKKVLAEYASYGEGKSEQKVIAKFNSKLKKLPHVKVLKDRARLVES